jgi:hypothetical protein
MLIIARLQNIYAEALKKSPEQDIWLLLCNFKSSIISTTSKSAISTVEEDKAHVSKFLENPVTHQQIINFTEAALIKYFQPEYNKTYKDTFPSPAHSTYANCYTIDLNLVHISIDTESLRSKLWSSSAPANWAHARKFHLSDKQERKDMFDLL